MRMATAITPTVYADMTSTIAVAIPAPTNARDLEDREGTVASEDRVLPLAFADQAG
jgi:hypothetical protein